MTAADRILDRVADRISDRVLRIVDNPRRFVVGLVAVIALLAAGFVISGRALVVASGADDRALAEVRRQAAADTDRAARIGAARDLGTCRLGNRNRPQPAINLLVVVDSVLERFGLPPEARKAAAASAVARLAPERGINGSVGPRDCNGDGYISALDYPPGQGPRPLLGPDGLPTIRRG